MQFPPSDFFLPAATVFPLADWDYLLRLRTKRARVIIHGLQKVRYNPRPTDDAYELLISFFTSAADWIPYLSVLAVRISIFLAHVVLVLLFHIIRLSVRKLTHDRALRRAVLLMAILYTTGTVSATGAGVPGDDQNGPRCQIFDGVNLTFMPWLISFSAWVAWKKPSSWRFCQGRLRDQLLLAPPLPQQNNDRSMNGIF